MVEFEEPLMSAVEAKLSDSFGYRITKHALEVQGYCPNCQESEFSGNERPDHV
jgi:Fe2+ or Zn2+ uptake regulation protein